MATREKKAKMNMAPPPTLEAIKYKEGKLEILDQLKLPHEMVYIDIKTCNDAWNAIKNMQVRGAPAIAIVGCLSLAVELMNPAKFPKSMRASDYVLRRFDYLVSARPTAVNIANARRKFFDLCLELEKEGTWETTKSKIINALESTLAEDVADNRSIGDNGAATLLDKFNHKSLNILTHCNTGSLATAGYGTALGVIRSLNVQGKLGHAYCTETRPYNQGARLTAFELVYEKIPATLVTDSMVGALMSLEMVDAVITGADQVTLNGDTANKIGTYSLAVLAKHHNIPFYIAVPSTTINAKVESGAGITIEQRPAHELTHVNGARIAAPDINVWNPAFDITPSSLITGYITEKGVLQAQDITKQYGSLKSDKSSISPDDDDHVTSPKF